MPQKWITKKGNDGRNRHIPIRERSRVRVREIKIPEEKKLKLDSTTRDQIERKLENFLGVGREVLIEEIVDYAVPLHPVTYGKYKKAVVFRIYENGTYDIGIDQDRNKYPGYESFAFKFSLIDIQDLPDFKSISMTDDGRYIDTETEDIYDNRNDLIDAVQATVRSWGCNKFNEEWDEFLYKFNNWITKLKKRR